MIMIKDDILASKAQSLNHESETTVVASGNYTQQIQQKNNFK